MSGFYGNLEEEREGYEENRFISSTGKSQEFLDKLKRKSKAKKKSIYYLKGSEIPDYKFKKSQLDKGIIVESEHTNNLSIKKAITKGHLIENKNYYNNKLFKKDLKKYDKVRLYYIRWHIKRYGRYPKSKYHSSDIELIKRFGFNTRRKNSKYHLNKRTIKNTSLESYRFTDF